MILAGALPAALLAVGADVASAWSSAHCGRHDEGARPRGAARGLRGGRERVVVGSKNFTEAAILGELLAQTVERVGLRAARASTSAGRSSATRRSARARSTRTSIHRHGADGGVEAAPERATRARARARTRLRMRRRAGVDRALGFDNTFALVIRGDERAFGRSPTPYHARAIGGPRSVTSSRSAPTATRSRTRVRAAVQGDPDHGPGPPVSRAGRPPGGPWSPATRRTRRSSICISRCWPTTGTTFRPTRRHPSCAGPTLERYPALAAALERLGGALPAETMRRLNYAVDGEHRIRQASSGNSRRHISSPPPRDSTPVRPQQRRTTPSHADLPHEVVRRASGDLDDSAVDAAEMVPGTDGDPIPPRVLAARER